MNDITFAEHYTEYDRKTVERIWQLIKNSKLSQSAIARKARVKPATMTQCLKGYYLASPTAHLKAVEAALLHIEAETKDLIAPVETSVFKLAYACCKMARRYKNIAVLSGNVGTGKTYALKHYARKNTNTILIEVNPVMSKRTLLRELAQKTVNTRTGLLDELFEQIIDSLKDTDSLIIIDEAEILIPNQLHLLRRVRDLAGIGLVLAGTPKLTGLLKPEHGQFEQIRSRAGFWPQTIQQITEEDAGALIQAAFGDEELTDDFVERMYQYSKGSARMLVEGLIASLREFRSDRELSTKLVDAVAKQALCLQPIK